MKTCYITIGHCGVFTFKKGTKGSVVLFTILSFEARIHNDAQEPILQLRRKWMIDELGPQLQVSKKVLLSLRNCPAKSNILNFTNTLSGPDVFMAICWLHSSDRSQAFISSLYQSKVSGCVSLILYSTRLLLASRSKTFRKPSASNVYGRPPLFFLITSTT